MAVGSWDPSGGSTADIDDAHLRAFIDLSRTEQLGELIGQLSPEHTAALPNLMQLDGSVWTNAATQLTDEDLLHLIRFFTVAENMPGCDAGEKSPVIPLAKLLRKRGQKLDKDLLQWIRQASKNRYLPYGPL
jgi:hypothetical protein